MKNVSRPNRPPSLVKNGRRWTGQVVKEIEAKGGVASEVSKSLFEKYNKDDVKKALSIMYDGLCCYCEERVGVVEYGHIEHRKPKSKYPKNTYDWDNMHLSCTTCNTNKGQQYNKKYPILDSVVDNPIERHLKYVIDDEGVWIVDKTRRGETTREHTDLNRWGLRVARTLLCVQVQKVILLITKSSPNSARARSGRQALRAKCRGRFGSMIESLMKQHKV